MRDKFGSQWTHGEEPNMGWVHALRSFSQQELERGLNNLPNRENNHWPPNAEEFADLCRMDFKWETAAQRHDFTGHAQLEDLTGKEAKIVERKAMMSKLRAETGL
jgi:hypothetical protein